MRATTEAMRQAAKEELAAANQEASRCRNSKFFVRCGKEIARARNLRQTSTAAVFRLAQRLDKIRKPRVAPSVSVFTREDVSSLHRKGRSSVLRKSCFYSAFIDELIAFR